MAEAVKQEVENQSAGGTTTLALTLAGAPTAGNLLVMIMAGDKDTGALTLAGFTQQFEILGASVSLYKYYKVSDGTETTINPSWANSSVAGNTAWYGELENPSVSGSTWQVSASASTAYDNTAVTARSSNTTGTTSAAGLAIAAYGVDSGTSVSGARVYTNSYAEQAEFSAAGGRGSAFVAILSVGSGVTTECQFSWTGTTDQVSGCVTVFTKVEEGAPPPPPSDPVNIGLFHPELQAEGWF